MFYTLIQVALGGAVGASCRWLVGVGLMRGLGATPFPLSILAVNILGSAMMGAFVVLAAHKGLTHLSPLVMTGFLGGFTTFSSFSLETMTMIERGQIAWALAYVALSVLVSIGALAAAMLTMRAVLT